MKHDDYLEDLVYNLKDIDENPKRISWIMKDGIWMPDKKAIRTSMPDIIAKYYDGHYLVAELKGSKKKRAKAIDQIMYGCHFLSVEHDVRHEYIVKKFVWYSRKGYQYEIINL